MDYQQYVIECFNYYKPLFNNDNQQSNILMNFDKYLEMPKMKTIYYSGTPPYLKLNLSMINDFNDPEIFNFFESIIIRFYNTKH